MFRFKIKRYIGVQTIIAACLNLGELINGYGVGWATIILPKLDDPNETPLPYHITQIQKSWIASVMLLGCIGAYIGGYLSNTIGRKRSLIIGGALNLVFYVELTSAYNLAMICLGRFLAGCSMSFLSVVGLIYIGEISSPNIRGITLTCMGVFHALGSFLAYCVGPFLNYAEVGYVVMSLNIVYIVACCWLPESPMYYVLKDDEVSARSTLQYLGRNTDINNELQTMMEKVRERKLNRRIWKELFSLRSNRKSLLITVALAFFQQSSGITPVILFMMTIFTYAGSSIKPYVGTIIVGGTLVLGSVVSPIFIEKYGRRVLLMVSTFGCCVAMAILGLYFYLRLVSSLVEDLRWLPLILLIFAQLAYSVGLTIIPNALSGELFTPKVRGLGPPISLCSGWVSGFISVTIFGYMVEAIGLHVTFWLFALINCLAFVFVVVVVPETKGKSLMEIEDMLAK